MPVLIKMGQHILYVRVSDLGESSARHFLRCKKRGGVPVMSLHVSRDDHVVCLGVSDGSGHIVVTILEKK